MDWGEAQEILGTHHQRGGPNETMLCAACHEEWPCYAVADAREVVREMAADPVYGQALAAARQRWTS